MKAKGHQVDTTTSSTISTLSTAAEMWMMDSLTQPLNQDERGSIFVSLCVFWERYLLSYFLLPNKL